MDWILLLAIVTFALVIAFLIWNRMSVKRNQDPSNNSSGMGGPNDPMAGTTAGMRDPDEMRAHLNAPANAAVGESPLRKTVR